MKKLIIILILFLSSVCNATVKVFGDGETVLWQNNSQTLSLAASGSMSESIDYIMPPADGSSGEPLITDGSGVLSFSSTTSITEVGTLTSLAVSGTATVGKLALTIGSEIEDDGAGYTCISGDGIAGGGLSITFPQVAGGDFYYGYGGTESHFFGGASELEIGGTGVIESQLIVDINNAEAFLVRTDGDGRDIFVIDTSGAGLPSDPAITTVYEDFVIYHGQFYTTNAGNSNLFQIFGSGGTNNHELRIDLESDANNIVLSSNTATGFDLGSMNLITTGTLGVGAITATSITFENAEYISNAVDGKLQFGGGGGTNNESLTMDFETTANEVAFGTTTSVTKLDFGSLDLWTTGEIVAGRGLLGGSTTPLNPGSNCVGRWRFEDNLATTVVIDDVGANNGVAFSNTDTLNTAGKFGDAFTFDGTDYVDWTGVTEFDFTDQFSIVIWFNTTDTSILQYIAITTGGEWYVACTNNAGSFSFSVSTDSGRTTAASTDQGDGYWADGAWHLLVATYDKSLGSERIKLYVDNVKIANANGYNEDAITGIAIRIAENIGASFPFIGKLDNFMLYNDALSEGEISALWNSGAGNESANYAAITEATIISSTDLFTFYHASDIGKDMGIEGDLEVHGNVYGGGGIFATDFGYYVGFDAPTLASSTSWTLPGDDGDTNEVFITDGSEILSWAGHDDLADFVANEHIDWTSTSENFDTSGTLAAGATTLDSLIVDTDTLVVDAVNHRVGIGTTSPDSIFHIKANVAGTVGSHPAGQLIIQDPDDTVFGNAVITGYESDGAGNPDQQLWYLGSSSSSNSDIIFLNRRNSKLQLGTNGVSHLTILGNGNIGIGTTNPQVALDVNGAIAGTSLTLANAEFISNAVEGVIQLGSTGGTFNHTLDLDLDYNASTLTIGSTASQVLWGVDFALGDNKFIYMGNAPDVFLRYKAWTTYRGLQIGTRVGGTTNNSGHICIVEKADMDNANREPAANATDPTLRIYSADAAQANDYIDFYHDQTDGVIDCGAGTLNLGGTANVNFAGATRTASTVTHDAYVELEIAGTTYKFMLGN